MRPFKTFCLHIGAGALAVLCASALPATTAAAEDRQSGRLSYVLYHAGSQSSHMSGSMDDLRRARSQRVNGEDLLYAVHGGVAYVVRDPATLRQARAILQPQATLGRRQAELGSRQAALGSRQARLGAEQARIGSYQAAASPRQTEALSRQQRELGRRQSELGAQQAVLGREQSALGAEQTRLGNIAQGQMRALIADALRRGIAQRAY